MKTLAYIAIVLLSGAIAGTALGILNQVLVEPYIEQAIAIEMQHATQSGEIINPIEFASYRLWQKGGEIAAGTILGLSFGALFGLVYPYTRSNMPGSSDRKKALVLCGIMWLVLFLIPALKYPANPPAVGDPETIYYRQGLYLALIAISGLAAAGLGILYVKLKDNPARKVIVPAIFASIIAGTFVFLPSNPDQINAPMDLVLAFRLVSGFTMSIFWAILGLAAGFLWEKLKPHETARIKAF